MAFHSLRVPLCGTEGLCVIIPRLTPLDIVLFLCIATSVTAVVHRRRRCIVLWCSQPVRLHASPAALLLGLALVVGALLRWRRAEDRAVRDALSPFDPALSDLARVATPPKKLPKRLRVALCIFGVVPRGIRTTWPMIQAHVIRPLRAVEAELHVTVFSIDTGNETVDGNATVDPAALKLFPAGTYMQVVRQSVVDAEIDRWYDRMAVTSVHIRGARACSSMRCASCTLNGVLASGWTVVPTSTTWWSR